ncbi:hypothetical protein IJG89_01835 [Candidatus Saccharibacteria bacterium]|nr:hypothetical protein [Candidatus Saccharibacteria bacterium]
MKVKNKFKKGAASFYMVAFSTLILLIIVASFAAVIVAEVTKTSNDDLAQSAYDSALAGVEDAKLAFYNYQKCVEQGADVAVGLNDDGEITCPEIRYLVEKSNSCDMVGLILGRNPTEENGGVLIKEDSSGDNNMQQAYTCVKFNTSTSDYRATLSASNPLRVVKPKFDNASASEITKVKISWYNDSEQSNFNYSNFSDSGISFKKVTDASVPPMISVSLIQTGPTFTLDDFEKTVGDQTDRGTLFLVPYDNDESNLNEGNETYRKADWTGETNKIGSEALRKSNDKTIKNLPYAVNCPKSSASEYACSATIELPEPIGGSRNDDTFVFALSLPYGKPTTSFVLEFFCNDDGTPCATKTISSTDEDGNVITEEEQTDQVSLNMVQIEIDSTGRANDLYRRVEARLEGDSDYSLSLLGPLELFSDTNATSLKKDYATTAEWNF